MKTRMKLMVFMTLLSPIAMQAQSEKDSLAMDSLMHYLPEVMITGERPMAVVRGNSISYDVPRIIEKRGIDNAYDALKELPGVMEQDGTFSLAGRSVTITLNGRRTTLSAQQMAELLKSIPASRLEKAEVSYSASAKTQVRGALINLRLRKETATESPLEAELTAGYSNQHNSAYGGRVTMLYHKDKMTWDLMYKHLDGRLFSWTNEDSHHTLADGSLHDIKDHEVSRTRDMSHYYRLSGEYDFAPNHTLSLTYQGSYGHRDANENYEGDILGHSLTQRRIWLHDFSLDYTAPFGLEAGFETTYYHDPELQNMQSTLPQDDVSFIVNNDQRVNSWRYYLSQEHKLGHDWGLNYGAWFKQSVNHSLQAYEDETTESYARQREDIVNIYAGFSKNWGQKLMLEASLAAEYYHSPVWHKWSLYPTLNLTYVQNPQSIWILSFETDHNYPEYWTMTNFTLYSNGGYYELEGNPNLKPSNNYSTSLVWVLRHKYQFVLAYNHNDDYFAQTPYQRKDRLVKTFKYLNFNYQQQAIAQAVVPHRFGQWLDSRLTLTGVWMHERCDDFYDIPFSRAIFYGMAQLKNTITLSRKPDLALSVDGMIRSKAHQAIYDLPSSGQLDMSLTWRFWHKQASLRVFCNDILETATIDPRIDYKGQRTDMDFSCYRKFGLSLVVRLGGYKEKKSKDVDMSRFRK